MSVGRICTRVIATALADEGVRVAAQRMAEYDVGTTVILSDDRRNRAVGIVTDRDITVRCVAKTLDLDDTKLSDVMTSPVQSVGEFTPIEEAVRRMASAGIRRLVVTGEEDRVVGILSLDDVLDLLSEETGAISKLLEKQKPHALA